MTTGDCFSLFQKAGVLSCATIAADGAPRLRVVSEFRVVDDVLYFLTTRGRSFCHQLLADPRIMLMAAFPGDIMVRLGGEAHPVSATEQIKWKVAMVTDNNHLAQLYPLDKLSMSVIFAVKDGYFEYVNRSQVPICRKYVQLGSGEVKRHGFIISDRCQGCGACRAACPQNCIEPGRPFTICEEHCLHCGACYEACPRSAIDRKNALGLVPHTEETWPSPDFIFPRHEDEELEDDGEF